MTESRPTFCPHCGEALPEGDEYAKPLIEDNNGDGSYDVYCPSCTWSGDIWPDAEQGIHAGNSAGTHRGH